MVTVHFSVYGDSQVERKLLGFSERARDLRPAFERMHQSFLHFEREQFDTEGATGSGGWAPLKASTVRRKAAKGEDPRILRAKNSLYESLTNRGDRHHIARIEPASFFFGTNDPKAKFHQKGTTRMPRRRPVELTETQRKQWVREVQTQLRGHR